jgi:hypothetical protein
MRGSAIEMRGSTIEMRGSAFSMRKSINNPKKSINYKQKEGEPEGRKGNGRGRKIFRPYAVQHSPFKKNAHLKTFPIFVPSFWKTAHFLGKKNKTGREKKAPDTKVNDPRRKKESTLYFSFHPFHRPKGILHSPLKKHAQKQK